MGFEWVEKLAKSNVQRDIGNVIKTDFVSDQIIYLNTEAQLFQLGINSENVKLSDIGGSYSPVTVTIKQAKGQPTNRVTLRDTGEFYGTFRVFVYPNGDFGIMANPMKDDTNLFEEWSEEIVGLTPENLAKILEVIEEVYFNRILI